jgi:hypothetical protein
MRVSCIWHARISCIWHARSKLIKPFAALLSSKNLDELTGKGARPRFCNYLSSFRQCVTMIVLPQNKRCTDLQGLYHFGGDREKEVNDAKEGRLLSVLLFIMVQNPSIDCILGQGFLTDLVFGKAIF